MSALRLTALVAGSVLFSAPLAAQEHVHAAVDMAAHDHHAHSMQAADQPGEAGTQAPASPEAPSSARDAAPAMDMTHAHAQHASDDAASMEPDAATHAPARHPAHAHGTAHPQHADIPQTPQQAASPSSPEQRQMSNEGMDHGAMNHGPTHHAAMEHAAVDHAAMDHTAMDHATMGHATATSTPAPTSAPRGNTALPREPIPKPTTEDIAAAFASLRSHAMHGTGINRYVLLDRLEAFDTDRGSGQAWEARAWVGGDINRLWLRSEGERHRGRTRDASVEAFYGHAISPWWDLLAGVRQDLGADHRSWAAFGVQGVAPYKFETEATLFVGSGRAAMRLEGEYDVLLTNRLILQPRAEATIAVTDDDRRGIDSGLQQVEVGVRLRYEITRRFAPYIGWVHHRSFGDRANATMDEEPARDSRFVAGVRIWF
ncbi:copper resistance protein B [Xanthomonas sp. NCPPB 1068]|uniref:copper resistance protein B n=1 Tax=Xanthomonas sp. NCPPB 1068 TaxID=487525 RepID=UPI00355632C9